MKECLVIIDVQNGFVSEKTKHIPDKVKALVEQKSFDLSNVRKEKKERNQEFKALKMYFIQCNLKDI